MGKLVAHSLRGIPNPPPITLIAHKRKLLKDWEVGPKELILETDGSRVPARGYGMELVMPIHRRHGVSGNEMREFEEKHSALGLRPHEIAELIKKKNEEAAAAAVANPTEREEARDETESSEPIHNLIVAVKTPRTVGAVETVKHRLLPTSCICFLQNGMGVVDQINKEIFPDPKTRPNYVQGIVSHGLNSTSKDSPFFTRHAGHGTIGLGMLPRESAKDDQQNPTDSAEPPPSSRYLIRTLTRTPVLAAVGLPPLELLQQQLEKLAVNAVLNPMTVILDAPNGSILWNFALTRTVRLLLGEISLVLRSLPELQGLPNVSERFSPSRLETLVDGIAWRTRDNISSMLADVRNGTSSEIAYINGYIVKRAEELGISPVCNYMIMQLVMGKNGMIQREMMDEVPVLPSDLTGDRGRSL